MVRPSFAFSQTRATRRGNVGRGRDPVKTTELLLPEAVRRKAAVSAGGEHAWRQHDVEEVLQEARAAGLACLGGQLQFQTPEGIAEAYWYNFDPQPQLGAVPSGDGKIHADIGSPFFSQRTTHDARPTARPRAAATSSRGTQYPRLPTWEVFFRAGHRPRPLPRRSLPRVSRQ